MFLARFLLIAVVAVVPRALGHNCRTNSSDGPTLYVSSQEGLAHLDGCTSLTGNIVMLADYAGLFQLNGVTNMTGTVSMNFPDYSESVTAFEMLDVLDYTGALDLYQVSDVRLPKVERFGELSLRSYKGGQADLGALVEASFVGIAGIWKASLQSLRHVGPSGLILASDVIDPWRDVKLGAIEVDLPALESAGCAVILGSISRLSLPRLSSIPGDPAVHAGDSGVSGILVRNPPLDVQLPSLTTLDYAFSVRGAVSTLNMSSLAQAKDDISVSTNTSADISFPVLEHAERLRLDGQIQSFNLSALHSATTLDISSDITPPCADGSDIYIRPYDASEEPDWCAANNPSSTAADPGPTSTLRIPGYTAHDAQVSRPLSSGAVAGIAVGCVIAVVVGLLAVVACLVGRRKARRGTTTGPVALAGAGTGTGTGVDGDGGQDGDAPPPPYSKDPGL
ncbi:hypothetical protein BDW62DRAFT_176534 [Aspergillus aurantiobrunneus]